MPNSSPPKRATMSPGRRWARRRGATARSSSSPAWWPMLSLISLKWSRSRKRMPTGEPETMLRAQRVAQRVDEAEPVGQAGQRVVQDAVAQRLVGGVALDRVGEHVGRGLHEVDVLRGEAARLGGVDVEHAEGPLLAVDRHGEAAAHAQHPQRRRHREASLAGPVVDDHVQARLERRAGVRVARRRGAALAPPPRSSSPARRWRRRPSRPTSQTQAASTPSISVISETASLHQRVGIAVLQRVARRAGPRRPAGRPPGCSSCSAILRSVMS